MVKKFGLLVIFLFLASSVISQTLYNWRLDRRLLGSVSIGSASYFGDVDSDFNFGLGTGQLAVSYNLRNHVFLRLEGSLYWIDGADKKGTPNFSSRGAQFGSRNVDLSFMGVFHLFPTDMHYQRRTAVNPYAFIGVGLTYFDPKALYQGEHQSLRPFADQLMLPGDTTGATTEEEWAPISPVLPVGAGVRFAIGYYYDILVEGGYRFTLTDYLDGVSNRGNPDSFDTYFIWAVKFSMYLPYHTFKKRRRRAPKFR